jgi:hypothetical protein
VRWAVVVGALTAIAVACTIADVDYTGKTCTTTCPSGLTCTGGTCQVASDAGVVDASPSPSTCNGIDAAFCDDFERSTLQGSWDTVTVINDGVLEIIADGDAGNHVLHTAIVDGSATTTELAYLAKQMTPNASAISYSFRVFVHGIAWSSAALASIHLDEGDGTNADISLELTYAVDGGAGGSLRIAAYRTQTDGGSLGATALLPLSADVWNDVSIKADFATHTLTVETNGVIGYEQPVLAGWTPGAVSVRAGLSYLDPTGLKDNEAFDLRIDDVVVTTSP